MITSKPQSTNFLSFILFLLIAWTIIGINILAILRDPVPPLLNYAVVTVLTPIALFILYKVVFRYKILNVGNGEITVSYPLFRILRKYPLKEILEWKETSVKTGKKSTFKELEIRFRDGRKITLGLQEYTEYDRVVSYLGQKVPKLRKG